MGNPYPKEAQTKRAPKPKADKPAKTAKPKAERPVKVERERQSSTPAVAAIVSNVEKFVAAHEDVYQSFLKEVPSYAIRKVTEGLGLTGATRDKTAFMVMAEFAAEGNPRLKKLATAWKFWERLGSLATSGTGTVAAPAEPAPEPEPAMSAATAEAAEEAAVEATIESDAEITKAIETAGDPPTAEEIAAEQAKLDEEPSQITGETAQALEESEAAAEEANPDDNPDAGIDPEPEQLDDALAREGADAERVEEERVAAQAGYATNPNLPTE